VCVSECVEHWAIRVGGELLQRLDFLFFYLFLFFF
jgi:hypothetical protein